MSDRYDLYIREHLQEMIDALRTLVKHPSVRGVSSTGAPFGQPIADTLNEYLQMAESYGFSTKNIDNYAGTVCYGSSPKLAILSHLDVVPVGNDWTLSPFDVTKKDGYLYGRGVIDDKGPTIATLFALRAIKDLQIPLQHGVKLIVGCDEESGSEDMDYYQQIESFPEYVFTPDGEFPVINIEKGRVQANFENPVELTAAPRCVLSIKAGTVVNAVPNEATAILRGFSKEDIFEAIDHLGTHGLSFETNEEDSLLTLTVHGLAAHASKPELGVNALTGLLMVLSALHLDGCDSTDRIQSFSTLFPFKEIDGTHAGINCSDEESGALTAVLSCFELTDSSCLAKCDIRFPVSKTKKDIIESLTAVASQHHLQLHCTGVEPHHVPTDSPFIQSLLEVYENVTGEKGYPIAIGGGTYVHGIPGGVAFGAEYPNETDENHMHGADERIEIEKLIETAVIYAHAIEKICN